MGKDELIINAIESDQLKLEKEIKIDLQVILQILIASEITTREDIVKLRKVVEANSPTILEINNKLDELRTKIDDGANFYDLFIKSKSGTATPEEKARLNKLLKDEPEKYGKLIYDIMKH